MIPNEPWCYRRQTCRRAGSKPDVVAPPRVLDPPRLPRRCTAGGCHSVKSALMAASSPSRSSAHGPQARRCAATSGCRCSAPRDRRPRFPRRCAAAPSPCRIPHRAGQSARSGPVPASRSSAPHRFSCRYPLATRLTRSLRRASNIVLYRAFRLDPSFATSASSGTPSTTIAVKTCRWCSVSSSSTARRSARTRSRRSDSWAGSRPKPVRQPVPVLRLQRDCGTTPEMPPDLAGHLEDDELVRPRGEPALAAELADLGDDRENGVRGGVVRQIVQFGPGDLQLPAAAARFGPRDAQQHVVQPGRGALPPEAAPAQRRPTHTAPAFRQPPVLVASPLPACPSSYARVASAAIDAGQQSAGPSAPRC